MNKTAKTVISVILAIAALFGVLALAGVFTGSSTDVATSEFFKKIGVEYVDVTVDGNTEKKVAYNAETGKKYRVSVNVYNLTAYEVLDSGKYKKAYTANLYPTAIFQEELEVLKKNGVVIDCSDPNEGSFLSSLVMPLLMLGVGVLAIMFLMRSVNGANKGAMDFGKTKARVNHNIKVRFADVAGAEEEKEELQEIVEFLKNPRKFSALGARIPKGVLLVGPPGTGKTLFAKAVAGEANVPFFSISGSDFVEMFVGVGASRVRDLFAMAKKSMPCIVFIDEIDAVGRQRGAGLGGGNDEREQTLNQLLVQMDGFEANDGIIIMAATNRADILDPALMRPGRFDRQIYVNMPDVRGREAILKVHSRNKPLAANVNFKVLARMTAGFSGADIANLLNEAAILAARKSEKAITNIDLYEAINKVIMGPQKKSRLIAESDKRITAYHESGHAILARLLPHCDPVQEVSIIPRGSAGGYTLTRPDGDEQYYGKAKLLDEIVMTYGGRVAEELIIKDISSGASSDIKAATDRARRMVTQWGMSDKVGPVNYGDNEQVFIGRDYETKAGYSEHTAAIIDEEVQRIIKEAHERAVELLTANKKLLDNMARLLIERETIYQDEVDLIMEGRDVKEILEFMDKRDKERIENPFKRYNAGEENSAANGSSTANNGGSAVNEGSAANNGGSTPENGEKVEEKTVENASETTDAPKMPTAGENNSDDKKE